MIDYKEAIDNKPTRVGIESTSCFLQVGLSIAMAGTGLVSLKDIKQGLIILCLYCSFSIVLDLQWLPWDQRGY